MMMVVVTIKASFHSLHLEFAVFVCYVLCAVFVCCFVCAVFHRHVLRYVGLYAPFYTCAPLHIETHQH